MNRKKNKQWWANRIVEYGQRPANQFLAHELNARRHPAKQREALRGSLDSVGWIAPTVVSARTGKLLDGHARIEEALSIDETMSIPFVEIDVSEAEERLILAAFDPITGLATYDKDALSALLKEVQSDDARINDMLAELAGSVGLLLDEKTPGAGGDEFDTTLDEEQTRVEYGDLWACGEHRVLCGDSTKTEDVGRVMAGEKAQMMFTDPPYGVNYEGGHFHSGDVNIKRKREELANDHSAEVYSRFLPVVLTAIDGPCYMWFAGSRARDVYNAVFDAGCEVHALIIWHKTNATYAAMNAQYKQRHEPCLYFKPKGATLRWCGASTEATVWSQDRDGINEFHPTQKPVALAVKAIQNHEARIVADFFGGSGTTLIACERTNRKARLIEIEPKYVNVILSRWEAEAGKTAQLLERRSLAQTG